LQTWGDKQLYIYRSVIDKALQTILQNPEIGHQRFDISERYRSYLAGQHLIFYRVEKNAVYVSRILHQRMDVKNAF
jgi:toxin ParE1/3/4